MVLSLVAIAVVALVLIPVLSRQTNEVAAKVAGSIVEPVAQRVLSLGRAETARATRDDLDEANTKLAARNLPIFEVPPLDAPNNIVARQVARAWSMVDYPEASAEQVRDEVRRGQRSATQPIIDSGPARSASTGDSLVTVIPVEPGGPTLIEEPPRSAVSPRIRPGDGGGPSGRPAPAPTGGSSGTGSSGTGSSGTSGSGGGSPAPAPASPAPSRRGLLPLLPGLPIRIPLLSD